jgi:hypothetical protein
MRNLIANITSLSDDANGVFVDQTTTGAGNLELDGVLVVDGVAYFDQAQKISIEGTGTNAAINATITGTDADGAAVSEVLAMANNGTVTSVLYYKTITSIYVDGTVDGNIEGGPLATNGAVSRSLRVNGQQMNFKLGLFTDINGVMTYSAQYTPAQPEDEYAVSYSASAGWYNADGMNEISVDAITEVPIKVNAVRLKISAYTSGTAKLTVTQSF